MADQQPWFLVMKPEDANRPGSQWRREGAASRGKVVALPIAPEGWIALVIFVAVVAAAPLFIWLRLFVGGSLSATGAIMWTVIVEAIAIAAFVMLVRARMTRMPPS